MDFHRIVLGGPTRVGQAIGWGGPTLVGHAAPGANRLDASVTIENPLGLLALDLVGDVLLRPPSAQITVLSSDDCRVRADGSLSTDGDGTVVDWLWSVDGEFAGREMVVDAPTALGTHILDLVTVDADSSRSRRASATVTMVDTVPPVLVVDSSVTCVWPPNHKWAHLGLGDEIVATASDGCGVADVRIVGASSSSGAAVPFDTDGVCIEATKASGDAVVYTIQLEATDPNGNRTLATFDVQVPKSEGCDAVAPALEDSCAP